ncbi:enoyl-CoA hydratase-related protein [Bacillus horti]|uniref:2-(1,2-epoxy-1,2-dihydrophenyl)acetyl-CoA isomerase n=1 Tax=Caldalkalibacillus horti TaxID=77523 RepID=A0ABT9W0C4_9BACI|nr:enoyl-CoA hydratase-related protein [Bacillus horti]MDQ0166703.1 2-(1,2-epoxy-1,2-dihydrophenyl)acetyl-CoA isomerase [Bacillus horti]
MNLETVTFTVHEKVGVLTLNCPNKLNAFTKQMNVEILQVTKEVAKNEEIRALVITGAGRAFCAGEDLGAIEAGEAIQHGEVLRTRYNPMMLAFYQLEKPVIAAVNGAAAGAGMSLALACDFRIASANASFIEAFIHIGLVPDSGSSYFLPRIVGLAKALELSILGEKLSAEQAQELGLVTKVTQQEELMEHTLAFAERLADMPTKAIGQIKQTIYKGINSSLTEALEAESYAQEIAGQTEDHREGIAAFLEKRKPTFHGK